MSNIIIAPIPVTCCNIYPFSWVSFSITLQALGALSAEMRSQPRGSFAPYLRVISSINIFSECILMKGR